MNIIKSILIVALVAVAGYFVITKIPAKSGENIAENNPVTTTGDVRDLCYIWNTEAGDSATLRMDIKDGTEVTGYFNWQPAEKDSKVGIFTGTAGPLDQATMSRTAKLWWIANAEGTTVTEELYVVFGDGIAAVGFGEMRDRGDGVYVYADPAKISYAPNLSQTDCNDPVVQ